MRGYGASTDVVMPLGALHGWMPILAIGVFATHDGVLFAVTVAAALAARVAGMLYIRARVTRLTRTHAMFR